MNKKQGISLLFLQKKSPASLRKAAFCKVGVTSSKARWGIVGTFLISILFIFLLSSYAQGGTNTMTLTLQSSAFNAGEIIPERYTCDGQDISPELRWTGAPEGTQSFALIFDDPDAPMGTWDHWVVFNIPADVTGFSENMRDFPEGTQFGNNSWNRPNYGGPCPPDKMHRYFFKLYALDTRLDLQDGVSKQTLEKAMEGHVLAQTELQGKYDRPR